MLKSNQVRGKKDSNFELQEILKYKPLWKDRRRAQFHFYCPQCRNERTLPLNPKPGQLKHFFQVGLTTALLTLLMSPLFGWKGVVVFVPLWIGFETYYRLYVRGHLSCEYCGFDPYLYIQDVKKARDAIETHWRKKFAEKGIPYPGDEPPQQESRDALHR